MKRLILIDSHAVIHRAYHALPVLTSPLGEPVHAVYGFSMILMRILRELKPDYIAAAFDLPGPTFRHIAYERYKAQRPETPSDLASQFGKVRDVVQAFGISIFEKEGYEADDIIGTIAKKFEKKKDIEMIVVTGDLDTLQLVRPGLKVYAMRKGITDTMLYDRAAVEARYGFGPEKVIDFKGLKGDPSDNIPGVKGIGEKTAAALILAFGSIDAIYTALKRGTKKIAPSAAARLRAGEEDARFSRELATIRTDVPMDIALPDLEWRGSEGNGVIRALLGRLGFTSLLKRLDEGAGRELKMKHEEADDVPLFARKGGPVYACDAQPFKDPKAKKFFAAGGGWFGYDAKSAIRLLRAIGVEPGLPAFDILLAAYVAEPFSRDFSYRAIAQRAVGDDSRDRFFEVAASLEKKLDTGNLRFVYEKIELPLAPILAGMEARGIAVDKKFLAPLGKKVDGALEALTKKIYRDAGEPFNIASPQQLSRILFEKLGIPIYGLRKTIKSGVVSTRESELEKLRGVHPIVGKVLEYRELAKLKTTYIDALPALINAKTGRVHTTFKQAGTATGRLSSANPNLQNIPIMSETGREIRKAFVAAPGFWLASFDYSQIELRVAAHLANDQKMIEAFRQGADIHKLTAAEIYNISTEKVTPELRRAAKTLNFGVLYGMGPQAFAESTGLSREEAKKFIDEYFRDFSGIRGYIERTKRFAAENGFVETMFGRRRWIPEIYSPNQRLRSEAERMAVNMPIQGSTADLVKMAMIAADQWIKKEKLENEVRMLLQVHDELLFEIKESALKKSAPQIKKIMEAAAELKAPLVVDVKAGPNWGEQKSMIF